MKIAEAVETQIEAARQDYQGKHPVPKLRIVQHELETCWHKLDHLMYLPILGLERPIDLYYYQGAGLKTLYGFTYKYLPLEQFLGQLTRLQIGYPLADRLAKVYSQAWYPGNEPIFIYTDWHSKPHWTKEDHLSGAITMWGRVMPGTHQLIIDGPEGHLLGGWNYPIDARLPHVLIDLEIELANKLERPIAYNIFDSEGGGLPVALRYKQAEREYISILPRQGHLLTDFDLVGNWGMVEGDPKHEAVDAIWHNPEIAQTDPRRLVLMRRIEQDVNPTRVYAGRIPAAILAIQVPGCFRQRWICQERRIRELVNGANLNANYGYAYDLVPNRTQRRQWEAAQARVETTERQWTEHSEALANLKHQQIAAQQTMREKQAELEKQIEAQKNEVEQHKQQSLPWRRCEQRQQFLERTLEQEKDRALRQSKQQDNKIQQHQAQHDQLQLELVSRQTIRDAIDTETQCRERNLEKDQIMLDLQVLLANLHDWVRTHYLVPQWQKLELNTATELIYRKPGRVIWTADKIEVILEPYRYPEQQQAMESTCSRFNAARLRWRDGRLLTIQVATVPRSNYAIIKVPV
ncbi:MAG: hypothetical protein EHM81_00905 [Chloroflexi bacterium]|nr:MAG: hypothetical protein EHM81_00905 [Chloroflexota bacterium]